jgi:ADP-heptose:LPS heptosyltransferase
VSLDVLVLRALGLGDTLAAVPALRALRRALPGRIALAGPAAPGRLVLDEGLVDDVVATSGLRGDGLPRGVRTAVNLHGRGPQSHRVLLETMPRTLVSFECRGMGVVGPEWRMDEPERARWCRLIAETWKVETDPDDVHLDGSSRGSPLAADVVIHPGASSAARRWPAERWVDVVTHLSGEHRVAITGSEAEHAVAAAIAERAGLPARRVIAGMTSVTDLAGLVASARLVLSGDTGIAHLAYAYGTPSVTLFGPTPPAMWGPPGRGPHRALWHGSGVGDPHADRPNSALLLISTAEVIAAGEEMLDRQPAR